MAIVNPHLGTDTEGGWAMGFAWGFVGPAFSSDPPMVIAPEQLDAFNEGVLAGQQSAIQGLPINPSCVSLEQEVSPGAEVFMEGVHVFEIIGLVKAVRHFAHFSVEGLVFVFLLMIPGPPRLDAAAEFGTIGTNVRDRLVELGLARKSLFLGAGIDDEVAGCELKFTSIFTQLDAARAAVQALGRPHFVIARWDADAPMSGGGFQAIESDAS
jgi:hypothetical protein